MKIQNQRKLKNLEIVSVLKQIDITLTNGTVVFIFQYSTVTLVLILKEKIVIIVFRLILTLRLYQVKQFLIHF